MFKLNILFATAVALACFATIAFAEAYKWTDPSGNIIYSQTPPPLGTPFEVVADRNIASTNSGQSTRTDNLNNNLNDSRKAREEKKAEKQRIAESNQIKRDNCKQAKNNLTSLTSHGQVTIKEGELYRKLTEEERQERIQTANANIEEYCS